MHFRRGKEVRISEEGRKSAFQKKEVRISEGNTHSHEESIDFRRGKYEFRKTEVRISQEEESVDFRRVQCRF